MDATKKPLAGKRIVVTRAPEQARELIGALERMGAEALLLPAVRFAAVEDSSALDAALHDISGFDWLLFTSQNAVRFFSRRCREIGMAPGKLALPSKLRFGAVGNATAHAITEEGMRVDFVANGHTGESLAQELQNEMTGQKVLLPRSDQGDHRLPKALRDAGANVTEVVAYRTMPPVEIDAKVLGSVRRAEVNAIIFASPSAFHNLCGSMNAAELASLSARVQFAAIGPTTARALREAGVTVEIEAGDSSSEGIAEAMANYYRQNSSDRHKATSVKNT